MQPANDESRETDACGASAEREAAKREREKKISPQANRNEMTSRVTHRPPRA